jgi:hypothetical protein
MIGIVDETIAERVGDVGEDDRHSTVETLQRRHAQGAAGKMTSGANAINCAAFFLLKVKVILASTNIDLNIATLAPVPLLHSFFECRN